MNDRVSFTVAKSQERRHRYSRRTQLADRSSQLIGRRQNHGALNKIFQLTDVAGPIPAHEGIHGFPGDAGDGLPHPAAKTREKILYEKRDVFAAIVKGWHFDGKDIEPIEEVLAEDPS